jgi:hypothetical protein
MSRWETVKVAFVSFRRWLYRSFFPRLHYDMMEANGWPSRYRRFLYLFRVGKARKLRPRPDVVTKQFLAQSGRTSYLCTLPLGALALGAGYAGDVVALCTCLCLAGVLTAHGVVTEYRVRRGVFGSNFDEAVELIEFILKENDKGRGPPGTRVSLDYQQVIPEVLGAVGKGA